MNPEDYIKWIQLIINAFALGAAGWIYKAYIQNLKATVTAKDEQMKVVEKNLTLWKDRVSELERKTPNFIEDALSKRIKIREEEIQRLNLDKENHEIEIKKKNEELVLFKSELKKTGELQSTISQLIEDFGDFGDFLDKDKKLETQLAGYVDVDSGQLMLTDPLYVDSQWKKETYEDLRLYKDVETGKSYQYLKDFNNYQEKIEGFDNTVNELLKSNRFEEIKVDRKSDYSYSYAGACYATINEEGFGAMTHEKGHEGAAVAFRTFMGDGSYPVYIETYGGRNIRMYVDLI
ncbi:hypothetical protein A5M85_11575 [Cellulophaga lytica]|uniref:coiled-coil domain-containing protein n=1 Tax=Cellulophaga lytica TaxID=979 RepID=UPI00095082A3|nr:hypothetical protein [Cellulophaga lytica]APU10898.1 hypothetical protein A5M85_11575 [Cellulophaga lytica]